MRARHLIPALGAMSLLACDALLGDLRDRSGIDAGSASPPDARPPHDVSTPHDATHSVHDAAGDAGARDARTSPDAPSVMDAGHGTDSWCSQRQVETFGLPSNAANLHHFCDDFDQDKADGSLGATWTVVPSGGTIELENGSVSSPPLAVRFTIPPFEGDGAVNTAFAPQMSFSPGGSIHEARCVFDFNIESLESALSPEFFVAFTMNLGAMPDIYDLSWVIESATEKSYAEWYQGNTPPPMSESLVPNGAGLGFAKGVAFSLLVGEGADAGAVFNVALQGEDAGSIPLGPPQTFMGFQLMLGFGAARSYGGGSVVDVDNVACDWH